ncbi:LysM peptidoglycan-binding domain-containing protein [Nocardioides acrostichi]|uniref:LysM peptidoglycan-binding domain-containing protein n=1 Tax=Nocardioides acrostichi TaxID=2784339 RepID=A0A930UY70_9ACTN|nr:LysM domain-containing protein [Nocardioides acrostichi]MBF4161877.1 LysM peptidoglycan-binding domain-containing protein [Nocardioides acrostichi]
MKSAGTSSRGLALLGGSTAALAAVVTCAPPPHAPHTDRFDTVLVWMCSWALVACAVWVWSCAIAVSVSVLRTGGVHRPRGVPRGIHRLLVGTCGLALVGATVGVAMPATATPGGVHHDQEHQHAAARHQESQRDDGRLARPSVATRPALGERPSVAVVRPGDSLWRITAARLGPDASDADIAAAWPRLYAANAVIVGADPDLISPGQRLRVPSLLDHTSRETP